MIRKEEAKKKRKNSDKNANLVIVKTHKAVVFKILYV